MLAKSGTMYPKQTLEQQVYSKHMHLDINKAVYVLSTLITGM